MGTLTLNEEILAAYGRYLHTNEKSPYTIGKYLRDAEKFQCFAAGRPLTKELTVDYKRYLIESGKYADSSINSMLASLRGLFSLSRITSYVIDNIYFIWTRRKRTRIFCVRWRK